MLGFIIRNSKHFFNANTLILLFNAFVRSKLVYGSIIWYPIYRCHNQSLEAVQRRFLKYLCYREDNVYPERGIQYSFLLNRFGITSLQVRRVCACIAFLYGLMHNRIDCSMLLSSLNILVPRLTTRSIQFFYCDQIKNNVCCRSPIYMMCNNFNLISGLCDINCDSLKQICTTICNHLPTP